MVDPVMFSSASEEWETPDRLFDDLHHEFGFTRDVCATARNRKRPKYWTKVDNALSKRWRGVLWCNPPYGRGIGLWVRKAATAAAGSATVVMLLPARTDTRWFHDWIWSTGAACPLKGVEVRFIRGRLKFSGHKNSAPFPSMIVIFRGRK